MDTLEQEGKAVFMEVGAGAKDWAGLFCICVLCGWLGFAFGFRLGLSRLFVYQTVINNSPDPKPKLKPDPDPAPAPKSKSKSKSTSKPECLIDIRANAASHCQAPLKLIASNNIVPA